jgi:hypothetical protein
MLFGVLGSRTTRVVSMAGNKVRVHGQPFFLREFETHPVLDFRSNELGYLEKVLARKVGDIRIAQDLLQESLRILRHFGSTDAPGNLRDLFLGVAVITQESGGDPNASLFMTVDAFQVSRVMKPGRQGDHFQIVFGETASGSYFPACLGYRPRMSKCVKLHPIRFLCPEQSFDVSGHFTQEFLVLQRAFPLPPPIFGDLRLSLRPLGFNPSAKSKKKANHFPSERQGDAGPLPE